MKKPIFLGTLICLLSGCYSEEMLVDDSFIQPNHIVMQQVIEEPSVSVKASFGLEQDPKIQEAYQAYLTQEHKTKKADDGFLTLAYNVQTQYMLSCTPLHLCVVQLEQGENINNIDIGDGANWLVSTSMVGTTDSGAYQILIKPKYYDIATDMVVSTTKRAYHFGLVSQEGLHTHVVNFYYPLDSLREATSQAHALKVNKDDISPPIAFDAKMLNFNYQLTGKRFLWRPVRVFDDGVKTYIQMPKAVSQSDLPVFYLQHTDAQELVNYRYQPPFMVVDGLFTTGVLISGKGKTQQRVAIHNIQLKGYNT